MVKKGKRLLLLAILVAGVWTGGLIADRQQLKDNLLRLHVVAASDSAGDQAVKLQVRDAILGSLEQGLQDLTDLDQALAYVQQMLPKLEQAANGVLEQAGFDQRVNVSLALEEFPLREYDTFSLPAGIYHALRVVIGEGEGQNWWCVVFPNLCVGAASEEYREMSAFSDKLYDTITGKYELRFWLLDQLGRLENFFHRTTEQG